MEEGQIARWVKNEGDDYEANETLAEVDTDKATMEMTALSAGTLLKILKGAGETAALGEPIAIIGQKGEDISLPCCSEISSNGKTGRRKDRKKWQERPNLQRRKLLRPTYRTGRSIQPTAVDLNGRLIVSPIAARMAAENSLI